MYMHENTALRANTTTRDRELRKKVTDLMFATWEYSLNLPFGQRMSFECHSISRAISMAVPELQLVDGYYMGMDWSMEGGKMVISPRGCVHSWLQTPDGAILDAYPVGLLAFDVLLVVGKGTYASFGAGLYRQDAEALSDVPRRKLWRKSQVLLGLIRTAQKSATK